VDFFPWPFFVLCCGALDERAAVNSFEQVAPPELRMCGLYVFYKQNAPTELFVGDDVCIVREINDAQ